MVLPYKPTISISLRKPWSTSKTAWTREQKMTISKRFVLIAFLLSMQAAAAVKEYVPPPAHKLLTYNNEWGYMFSPDGKRIAHVEIFENRHVLQITDPATLKTVSRLSLHGGMPTWLNENELAYARTHIHAFGIHGENRRILVNSVFDEKSENKEDRQSVDWRIIAVRPDDKEHIVLSSAIWTKGGHARIHKVNIYTGAKEDIADGYELDIDEWIFDSLGNIRVGAREREGSTTYFAYDPGKGDAALTPLLGKKSGIDFSLPNNSYVNLKAQIVGFSLQNNLIYVEDHVTGDRARLVSYDPVEDRVVDVLLEDDFYDIDCLPHFNTRSKELLGFFLHDKYTNVWLDKRMHDYQRKIDALSPDTINNIFLWSPGFEYLLVTRSNSKGFDKVDVYTTKTNSLATLSDRSRDLAEYTMAETRKIRYQARDGYTLEGFLTVPPDSGSKQLPLIVTTLEQPWQHYINGYYAEAQFFATRGYAVFSPNYRGTIGRGRKHLVPDTQNLLALMQDDIADGVKSLIKDGTADGNKIFINGQYYGGHLAILSAIRYPDLYKGVFAKNAILDLTEHYEYLNEGAFAKNRYKYMQKNIYFVDLDFVHTLLANSKPSAKLLEQHSPQHLVNDIKTPLLVFHGKKNSVVEFKQVENFLRSAQKLKNGNITIKFIDKEGHRGWDISNDSYYLEKSLEFIMKNEAGPADSTQGGSAH
jgi:dipeptidyl aminopeptidase/acylaminoacyl peptidase